MDRPDEVEKITVRKTERRQVGMESILIEGVDAIAYVRACSASPCNVVAIGANLVGERV